MRLWWFTHENGLYSGILIAGFLLLAAWETYRPRRVLEAPTGKRWLLHGFFLFLTSVTGALALRTAAVGLALAVSGSPYGVLNRTFLPFPIQAVLSFLLLDFVRYTQHYACHSVPFLWRIHQIHHSDRDFDLSTGVRFHPLEVLFTDGSYFLLIAVLAPLPSAVLCYEMCGVAQAFFSHANIRLPMRLEKVLRRIQVTPEIHRIHHSIDASEQRFNFANLFSFWDRLFRTYRDHPEAGEQMQFGLAGVAAAQSVRPLAMLALPFVRRPVLDSPPQEALPSKHGAAVT
jgi:sterol desaturase/sphingolipid hydroxylase (fatty acid hydroxylase superfamily)